MYKWSNNDYSYLSVVSINKMSIVIKVKNKMLKKQKIKAILIDTTNEAKYQIYKDLLSPLEKRYFKLKKLLKKDADDLEISESFNDLEANTVLKATTYTNVLTLI